MCPCRHTRKTEKQGKSTSRRRKQHRRLLDILGETRTLKAWLRAGKGSPTEAFVILAQGLSAKDREFLSATADLVVDPGEDLVGRLAALERENRQLKSLSLSDDLTGLYNKRFFSIQLEIEMARAQRTGLPCSLMMIDFDNFKEINDRLGHDEGDRFLIQMGGLIREKLRPTDFVCRYGGDEFAVHHARNIPSGRDRHREAPPGVHRPLHLEDGHYGFRQASALPPSNRPTP